MKMLFAVGIALCGIAALLFVVGAFLPSEWVVQRSVTINARPAAIYPLMSNFKTGWSQWNPWEEPSMKISFEGPDEGVGAAQSWEGGDTNGGSIRITKAEPTQGVEFALTFGPFPIDGKIAMKPVGEGQTEVTWTDVGKISGLPVYRYMRFMVDRFVGQPMDRGLGKLKQIAEARATPLPAPSEELRAAQAN